MDQGPAWWAACFHDLRELDLNEKREHSYAAKRLPDDTFIFGALDPFVSGIRHQNKAFLSLTQTTSFLFISRMLRSQFPVWTTAPCQLID
jgi:hypothetical protein